MNKAHDPLGAAEAFFRVAEHYVASGFLLKAVALAKQVLKLHPEHPTANETLAALHLKLGLTSEAVAYCDLAMATHRRAGNAEGEARVRGLLAAAGVDVDGPRAHVLPAHLTWGRRADADERLDAAQQAAANADLHSAVRLAKAAVVKLNPRLVQANELLGEWSATLGATEDAIVYWRAALRQHEASRDLAGIARAQAALAALGAVTGAKA